MDRLKLGRGGHSGKRIIHVLATGFIRTQVAKGGRVTRGHKGAKGLVIWGTEQLGLRRVARKVQRVAAASEK
eukprot:4073683-Pleurochrysis_carterae.AAC.1